MHYLLKVHWSPRIKYCIDMYLHLQVLETIPRDTTCSFPIALTVVYFKILAHSEHLPLISQCRRGWWSFWCDVWADTSSCEMEALRDWPEVETWRTGHNCSQTPWQPPRLPHGCGNRMAKEKLQFQASWWANLAEAGRGGSPQSSWE